MKKLTIIGLSVLAVVGCILLFWQHSKTSRDRGFSQKLAGAWSWKFANIRETWEFAPDGNFTALDSYSNRTNAYQMSGTWKIKGGKIIQIISSDSHKKTSVPRTNSAQIVRLDARGFIVAVDTNKMEFSRIIP
jgi:hypothetical protein